MTPALPDRLDRAHRRFFRRGTAVLLVFTLFSCAQSSGTVRGVVVSVDGTLAEVTSFTLLVDGEEIRFVPDDDGEYAFPLSHLREHRTTGQPVIVEWETVDGERHALSVADG